MREQLIAITLRAYLDSQKHAANSRAGASGVLQLHWLLLTRLRNYYAPGRPSRPLRRGVRGAVHFTFRALGGIENGVAGS